MAEATGERKLLISTDSHNHRLAEYGHDDETAAVKAFAFSDFCKQNKIKKISLLKIDIEGGEYEVFAGMSDQDLSMVNFVILEYHTSSPDFGAAEIADPRFCPDFSRAEIADARFCAKAKSAQNRDKHKQIEEKLRENGFGVQVFPSRFDKTMGFIWANNKRIKF